MPNTTNFGWATPADTDLVKDGAAAIRTLGSSIDTSLVDLKGGTTGQVLTKASNTDLDFSFTTPTDQTPLTTKGDLFTFTTVDARIGVGANGTVLTADSAETTGLKWVAPASGSLTQLATGTFSGSSVSLTSIPGTYKKLLVFVSNLYFSATGTDLLMRANNLTGIYTVAYANTGLANTSGGYIGTSAEIARFWNSDKQTFMQIEIPNYTGSHYKIINSDVQSYKDSGGDEYWAFQRAINGIRSTASINELNFLPSTGTFSGGTYTLFGVN